MANRLKDRIVVVTGAGRGIGRGIALLMAEEGAKVVVNDLGGTPDGTGKSTSAADEVVAEIKKKGGIAVANYDSVATKAGGENIVKTAIDNFGRLDILVNNAGVLRDRMIFNLGEEEWDIVIKVHLYGHYYCTKPACVVMRQQRYGRIINMSSRAALGTTGQANYSAAKAGILGLTRTVARDMGRYGITCNVIFPAADTRLTMTPEVLAAREKRAAMGIAGVSTTIGLERREPEDVAPIVVFLATEQAGNINGCTFHAVGGRVELYSDPVMLKSIYKEGRWTVDELAYIVPITLASALVNPSPPQPPAEKK